jgi:DeoR/GlpR family transcriptional regulator of sugar metabolism
LLLNEGGGKAVVQTVSETYEVSEETIFSDLTALVHGLQEAGLVKVVGA